MFPTSDQVRLAAYHRWRRRGGGDGRDLDDWTAAEQDLLFTINYQVIAHHGLISDQPRAIGDPNRRVCRFCEQSAPRTTFSDPVRVLPESAGPTSPIAFDQCDECRAAFEATLKKELEEFLRSLGSRWTSYVPIAAFKGLTWLALSIMPRADLESFPDAIEWVLNPDHDQDSRSFDGLGCYLHRSASSAPAAWMAIARRIERDAPVPHALVFLGMARAVVVFALPLCLRDEDRDGEGLIVPRVASPDGTSPGDDESPCVFVPMSSTRPREAIHARSGRSRDPVLDRGGPPED